MISKLCDICGKDNNDTQNYCYYCGVRLKPRIKRQYTKATTNTPFNKIKACELSRIDASSRFFIRLYAFYLIVKGDVKVIFCDCARCNQIYREILAEAERLRRDEDVEPDDPDIVKMAYNKNLKDIELDFGFLTDSIRSSEKRNFRTAVGLDKTSVIDLPSPQPKKRGRPRKMKKDEIQFDLPI